MSKIKKSLAVQVFIAMVAGIAFGLLFGDIMVNFGFIGSIWLNSIKMVIVPMILVTLVVGIVSQKDLKSLGRVSGKIMLFYITTTAFAAIVGIISAMLWKPGLVGTLSNMGSGQVATETTELTVSSFFLSLFSDNMFATFAQGNIIQTLVIAILLGISVVLVTDQSQREKLIDGFQTIEALINSLIGIIMKLSPIGIFFLMGESFGKYGTSIFGSIAALLGTFYFGVILQIIFIYGSALMFSARINPLKFIKDSAQLWLYTISTCSSVAAIPVNMKIAREKFGVEDKISSFTIPLGSQINSDGSVILYGCVLLFIAQMNGITFSMPELIKMIFLATIFSLGGSGIPGSNIVKILILVEAFGLPTEIVGIVAAFYRLFDMGTTTNNCLGDLAGTVVVSNSEKKYVTKENKNIQPI